MNKTKVEQNRVYPYAGIGFIRSKKSDSVLMDVCSEMYKYAEKKETKLFDIVVERYDDSNQHELKIKRKAIQEVLSWMRKDPVTVVFIRSVDEITTDKNEFSLFLLEAESLGVTIHTVMDGANKMIGEGKEEIRYKGVI